MESELEAAPGDSAVSHVTDEVDNRDHSSPPITVSPNMSPEAVHTSLSSMAHNVKKLGVIPDMAIDLLDSCTPVMQRVIVTRFSMAMVGHSSVLPEEYIRYDPWVLDFDDWCIGAYRARLVLRDYIFNGQLPEWIGVLEIYGSLNLSRIDNLYALPDSICFMKVSGNLKLSHNKIEVLPPLFHMIQVGGDLKLNNNRILRLPDNFPAISVGRKLILYRNVMTSLPPDIGDIRVGADIDISKNELNELPSSINRLVVRGSLHLHRNRLTELPPEIGNMTVGKNLRLDYNDIRQVPPEMKNTKVKGYVTLSNNPLEVIPSRATIPRLILNGDIESQCVRRIYKIIADFILSCNVISLALFYISVDIGSIPYISGMRFCFSNSPPSESTEYALTMVVLLSVANSLFRYMSVVYEIELTATKMYIVYPVVTALLIVAYDAARGYTFHNSYDWVSYIFMTLTMNVVNSIILSWVYRWCVGESLD